MTDIIERLRRWTFAVEGEEACDLMEEAAGEIEKLRSLTRFQDRVIRSGDTACLTQDEQYAIVEAAKSFAYDEDDEEFQRISSALYSLLERMK